MYCRASATDWIRSSWRIETGVVREKAGLVGFKAWQAWWGTRILGPRATDDGASTDACQTGASHPHGTVMESSARRPVFDRSDLAILGLGAAAVAGSGFARY